LRRPLLRLEVHVHQPETIAEPLGPLKVVHRAPLEVALHRHAVFGRPLELSQVSAEEHDAVGVINLAVVGNDVLRRAAVLGDASFAFQRDCTNFGAQYIASGPIVCQRDDNIGCPLAYGIWRQPGAWSEANTYSAGL